MTASTSNYDEHTQNVETRKANIDDLLIIKRISDSNKKELGFITRQTIVEAIQQGQIIVVTVDGMVVGFQHYNHRKRDGQTTLYHKAIEKSFRGNGLGTTLVDAVVREAREMGRTKLLLKCPVDLPSNKFHKNYGFFLVGVEKGKKRKLNIWEFPLT